jgi:acetyltransferase-like isoleucine patch superfamily enzyme
MLIRILLLLLPWRLRRPLLQRLYGYELHPQSRIGLAWAYPRRLVMAAGARIDHLSVVKGLDNLLMGECASIGRLNWISGYPSGRPPHFAHQHDRRPELDLGAHAAITNRHIVDCTDRISIGAFATVAGFRSQLLTHSINLETCRQEARPISIGAYCFVGTACTVLGGANLPDYCVLGAHSLLNKSFSETHRLYAGVPAEQRRELSPHLAYFKRKTGVVT